MEEEEKGEEEEEVEQTRAREGEVDAFPFPSRKNSKKKKKRKHCPPSSTRAPSSHADHARGTGASRRDERGSAEKEESKEESKRGGRRGRAGEYWREPRMPLCLSFAPLLFSSLALLLPWEITDTPLAPPRSRVSLRALAPPTHRAGATRRGRCDTTGREARKEDLDAERLCMVLRSRKRGGERRLGCAGRGF